LTVVSTSFTVIWFFFHCSWFSAAFSYWKLNFVLILPPRLGFPVLCLWVAQLEVSLSGQQFSSLILIRSYLSTCSTELPPKFELGSFLSFCTFRWSVSGFKSFAFV
jgi:hypothetical protein